MVFLRMFLYSLAIGILLISVLFLYWIELFPVSILVVVYKLAQHFSTEFCAYLKYFYLLHHAYFENKSNPTKGHISDSQLNAGRVILARPMEFNEGAP